MHQEITEAIDFIGRLLHSKLDQTLINVFKDKLYALLSTRFADHWDVGHPYRGNAYRAVSIFNGQLDPILSIAAQQASIPPTALLVNLPQEFVLWVDPLSVSYRVGDHGNIMDLLVNGKSLKERKKITITSTPIRISPPTSPASLEKKLQQQQQQQQKHASYPPSSASSSTSSSSSSSSSSSLSSIQSRPSSPLAIHARKEQEQQQQQKEKVSSRQKTLVLAH